MASIRLIKDEGEDYDESLFVEDKLDKGTNEAKYGRDDHSKDRFSSYPQVHDTTANGTITSRLKAIEAIRIKPALRSRLRHKQRQRQSQSDTAFHWSNVPGSSTASPSHLKDGEVFEQLSRLKIACHYAWVNFLHDCPSFMNNNIKGDQSETKKSGNVDLSSSSSLSSPLVKTKGVVLKGDHTASSRSASLSLYKFLKLIATFVVMFLKLVLITFILIFTLYCLMVLHKPTQALVSRHTQDLIYPFMRTIRFGSLPLVSRFPQLHELYEDACVLANPFFEMNDVSCWPCESVRHVIDLTGFSNFTSGYYHSGIPFIIKDAFTKKVDLEDICRLYEEDLKMLGSVMLQSPHDSIETMDDLCMHQVKTRNFFTGDLHAVWKINRAQYARQLRKYFSRPYFIPNSTEISVQHFLFIDEPASDQYSLPVTEFANVFVMQADGRRLIVLVPVRHCRSNCKAISVVLQPNDVLFYNWLFWQPVSFPMSALEVNNELSITYVGSFY